MSMPAFLIQSVHKQTALPGQSVRERERERESERGIEREGERETEREKEREM